MNSVQEFYIKNRTYYFFVDMINIQNLHPNTIKIYKNLYNNIPFDYIPIDYMKYMRVKKPQ